MTRLTSDTASNSASRPQPRCRLDGIAPIVPVRRVARSVDFYCGVLGFDLVERDRAMTSARVRRGEVALLLLDLGEPKALQATAQYLSAYVWVEDVDALWAELGEAVARLPPDRVVAPFTRKDGRREFHLRDPDGFLLFFGTPQR